MWSVSGTGFPANSNITVDYGITARPGIATGRSDAPVTSRTAFGIPSDATIGGDATVKPASVPLRYNDYEAEADPRRTRQGNHCNPRGSPQRRHCHDCGNRVPALR